MKSKLDNALIHPTAYISPEGVVLGDNVRIGPGTVIGVDGFQVDRGSSPLKIVPHLGGVRIGNNVDIGANCVIDRGLLAADNTYIGNETKIGSLCHISHNSRVGDRVLMPSKALVAGSVVIGDDVWVGPGAVISNGITIGNKAFLSIGAVVIANVKPGERVAGNFAVDNGKFLINHVRISKGIR